MTLQMKKMLAAKQSLQKNVINAYVYVKRYLRAKNDNARKLALIGLARIVGRYGITGPIVRQFLKDEGSKLKMTEKQITDFQIGFDKAMAEAKMANKGREENCYSKDAY